MVIKMPGILQISRLFAKSHWGEEFTLNKTHKRSNWVMERSRNTKQAVNLQCSRIYRVCGCERRKGAAARAAAQRGALWTRAPDHWKKEGKAETNLTSERDLLADESEQQNAPVRDDGEQKSYGKENCSCGETKTTTRRVSLLRSGIHFVCLFSVGRDFSLVLQSRTWKLIGFVVTTDSLAIEGGKGLLQGQMMDEGGEGKQFKPHNEWQKIREADVISKNNLASGLWFQSLVARTSQAVFSSLLSIFSMCESIKNEGDSKSLKQQ